MALLCKTTSTRETDQVANIREASSLLKTRRDPRILKLPPYLAALCIFVGVAWLLLLPLDDNSRQTYISENALLPGQVHTYFGGSEQNIFRAYKQEVQELVGQDYTRYAFTDRHNAYEAHANSESPKSYNLFSSRVG